MSSLNLDLQLEKAVEKIKEANPKNILIQLPDGLKPKAAEIKGELEKHTSATIYFWLNSCYGACDIPEVKGIDLLIQFGHTEWR
ncbi:MAG: diphthamide synthesis protein [Candidatus Woesearchaeota archaeon]